MKDEEISHMLANEKAKGSVNADNDQPDSGVDLVSAKILLQDRIGELEALLKETQEDHAQTSQHLEQTQAERNVLQYQKDRLKDRLVEGEPDSEEATDNVQPDHQGTLLCGCIPHRGADRALIDGCPVKFANDLLNKQREKDRQLKGMLSLFDKIIEGEPILGFRTVKDE